MKKLNRSSLIITGLALLINILALILRPFANAVAKLQAVSMWTFGRLFGLLPFSVGEVMIVVAIIYVVAVIVSIFIKRIRYRMLCVFFFVVSCVLMIMTINCFVLYHADSFGDRYLTKEYNYEQDDIYKLREYIVSECNRLSLLQERDEQGHVTYDKSIELESVKAMKALGKTYSMLDGVYPKHIKKIHYSEFMSQQYVAGIYYPFSMESNVNTLMYITNYPATMCHELAHLKGFIYEDDANFIAYLACTQSDDVFMQYSGFLSVLDYVLDACDQAKKRGGYDWELTPVSEKVWVDDIFLDAAAWKKVEENAVISTEIVSDVADKAIDTSLKFNGVKSGIDSYNEVVQLLLRYADTEER
ncbi:MAG: DUF3810 domain-containing protein [Lachnospiraceae bacterium]|nr:DUF3810 domain-containing protein [Lachnospiraceae bacterium]